jgi:hypothetical protein
MLRYDVLCSDANFEWEEGDDQGENNTPVRVEEVLPDEDNVTS